MTGMKRIMVLLLCISVVISMVPFTGTGYSYAAGAKTVEVVITDSGSDILSGYYISYTINGIKYSSDTAGERINQIAWEHMSEEQRMQTLNAFGTRLSERQAQFGFEYSGKMAKWYNDVTGWTELAADWHEKIVKKNLPTYYAIFGDPKSTYFEDNLKPDCSNSYFFYSSIDIQKTYAELCEYYSYASSAYEALCNAQVLKYRVSVMCLSGDLISLITDKALVPNITPSGSGLLSTSISTTCWDYVSSVTGIVDGMQDYVVGKRIRAGDATAVMAECDRLIERNKWFIDYCLNNAKGLKSRVETLHDDLLVETEAAYDAAEAADADLLMATEVDREALEPDSDIMEEIEQLQNTIDAIEAESPKGDDWDNRHDQAIADKDTYLETTKATLLSETTEWLNTYIGDRNSTDTYTAESKVGQIAATAPQRPQLNDEVAGKLLQYGKGTAGWTKEDFDRGEAALNEYITAMKAFDEQAAVYSESARNIALESRQAYAEIHKKALALEQSEVNIEDIEAIRDKVEVVMHAFLGNDVNDNLKNLTSAYQHEEELLSDSLEVERYSDNLNNNKSEREAYIIYLKKKLAVYKDAVRDYEQSVGELENAYDATEEFASSLPSYIKDQEVSGSLEISSTSELSSIKTQSQVDSYAEQLDGYMDSYQDLNNSCNDAERTRDFLGIKVKNMNVDLYLLETFGINVDNVEEWSEVKDDSSYSLTDDTTGNLAALKYLWRDFNGRGYGHTQMMEYFADLCDNYDKYSTSTNSSEINKFNTIKSQVASFNMGAHSYVYNIEHKTGLLCASANLSEIDPRNDLVMPIINSISSARGQLTNNLRSAPVSITVPAADTRIDNNGTIAKANAAVSNTTGLNVYCMRAVDTNDNLVADRLEAGKDYKFRVYIGPADGYCIDDSCSFSINGVTAYLGNDSYGQYITTNEEYSLQYSDEITVITQPEDATYDPGDNVTFTCEAEGEDLSYQWKLVDYSYDPYDDKKVETIGDLPGQTSPSCILEDVSETFDGREVYCEISNESGCVVTDRVKLNCTIGIVSEPEEYIKYDLGSDITINIKTKGDNPEFTWYMRKADNSEYSIVNGNSTDTLTINNADESYEYCDIMCDINFGGITINRIYHLDSNITLKNKLPEKVYYCPGKPIELNAEVLNTGDLDYEWYVSLNKSYSGDSIGQDKQLCWYMNSAYDGGYIYCEIDRGYGKIFRTPLMQLVSKHDTYTAITPATLDKNGRIENKCSSCSKILSSSIIYMPKPFMLSAATYTYDGKAKKPSVTVKDVKGNTLKSGTDYTVAYANNKDPGKAYAKIIGKGKYKFTKTLYYTINPKGTSISSLAATSRGFTVKWKKQSTKTSGYQIRYSTKSSMASAKTVTIASTSTISKKVTKLTAKKKYYVQVRTYRSVSGKKYYSSWSTKKYVATKK